MAQTVKRLSIMRETLVRVLGWEDPLEEEMALFLPGKYHGLRNLADYSPLVCERVGHDLATKQQIIMRLEDIAFLEPYLCY